MSRAGGGDVGEVVKYARKRYLIDAEFHARVERAVQLLDQEHRLSDDERALATTAAAVGLAMEWVDPTTGRIFDD